MQIPKPCFLLYFLPFHWIFLLNRVPFCHLLYESATFSFHDNPKEIYLVSKIFLILTKVLHTQQSNTRQNNKNAKKDNKRSPKLNFAFCGIFLQLLEIHKKLKKFSLKDTKGSKRKPVKTAKIRYTRYNSKIRCI